MNNPTRKISCIPTISFKKRLALQVNSAVSKANTYPHHANDQLVKAFS